MTAAERLADEVEVIEATPGHCEPCRCGNLWIEGWVRPVEMAFGMRGRVYHAPAAHGGCCAGPVGRA